jgi:uncharacterized protein YbjT (DUF2867 family)
MSLVLITGGTGGLGSELVPRFAASGHAVRVMSRRPAPADAEQQWAQADLATGEGLAAAVAGVDLIVHCATSPFRTKGTDVDGTGRLLQQALAAGKPHFFYISIVGIDRIPFPYYKHKLATEKLIEESGLPWSNLRAVQFHTLLDRLLGTLVRLPVGFIPKDFKFQPMDPGEVAERMVKHAANGPSGRLSDLGGPEVLRLDDIARAWLKARRKRAALLPLPLFGKIASGFRNGYNCTPEHSDGKITWAEWLERKYG